MKPKMKGGGSVGVGKKMGALLYRVTFLGLINATSSLSVTGEEIHMVPDLGD